MAIAAIKQQEAQLAISYSNSMPILSATADWNQIRFIAPKKPSGYNEVAFLELNFPIFQGFDYMNQQRQLRAQIEQALAGLDVQVAAVSTQVVYQTTTPLPRRKRLCPLPQQLSSTANAPFRGYVVQYKTGTASILDMLTALTTLSNARSQLVLTRTNKWANSLANLSFSVGMPEDTSGLWEKAPPAAIIRISHQR